METQTIQIQTPQLPPEFINYINSKLENHKKGRKHVVQQLGSIDRVLELLADIWLNNLTPKELTKKYNIGYFQLYRLANDVNQWREQIIAYLKAGGEEIKDLRQHPIIQEWAHKIRISGSLSQLRLIPILIGVLQGRYCDFKCSPVKFDLQKAQEFAAKYFETHPNQKKLPRHIRMAIRHFLMVAKNINIPRGFGATYGLSGEKDNFGAYRYVYATQEQINKIREYLSTPSLNSLEALVFFDLGIESLARATTLAQTKISDFKQQGNIVTINMYESKTDRIFQKFLLLNIEHCKQTWENIQKLIKITNRNCYLFFNKTQISKAMIHQFLTQISPYLKAAYKHAGVTDEYAYFKPFHFLRHTGAHLWLMRTNYDYGLVAELGWEDINTLRQVYGGMPPQVLQAKIVTLSTQNGGLLT